MLLEHVPLGITVADRAAAAVAGRLDRVFRRFSDPEFNAADLAHELDEVKALARKLIGSPTATVAFIAWRDQKRLTVRMDAMANFEVTGPEPGKVHFTGKGAYDVLRFLMEGRTINDALR